MSERNACCYEFGDYRLDVVNYRLLKNESPVQLTQKSFEILQTLIENRDRVVKKEELLNLIWDDCYVEDATLTQHIYMLRKSLKENGNGSQLIETVPKFGYRFTADVREVFTQNGNPDEDREMEFEEISISETLHTETEIQNQNYEAPFPHTVRIFCRNKIHFQKKRFCSHR